MNRAIVGWSWRMAAAMGVAVVLAGTLRAADAPKKDDYSSPKAAANSFLNAIIDGDADAAKKATITTDDKQADLVATLANMMRAVTKFEAALKDKFPDLAATMGAGMAEGRKQMEKSRKDLEAAEVTTEGDVATIKTKEDKPVKIKKIGGDWKVDISSMPDMPKEADVAVIKKIGKAMDTLADDIKAGKYKTAEEVGAAMGKMMQE